MIDASLFEFYPPAAAAIDVSSTDADLTAIWPGGNGNTDKQPYARGIYVGQAGDLKVDMLGATAITFSSVPVGSVLRGVFTKVYHSGTVASKLVVLK